MCKIKCIIVEDEPLAVRVLAGYIEQIPFLELAGSFKDAILAAEYLRTHAVGLMFLDIHLPKLRGMAFLKTLTDPPAVIITTAYHQYAIEGFNLNVVDYLLKPVRFERFMQAVNKVRTAQELQGAALRQERDFIFLNVQKKKVKIRFSEIAYVESRREYVRIVTTGKEYLSKMSTHEIEQLLPEQAFKRIHRSFIVAIDRIEAYTAEAVEIAGVSIPIGRGYREVVEEL